MTIVNPTDGNISLTYRLPNSFLRLAAPLFAGRIHRWAMATSRTDLPKLSSHGKQMILVLSIPDELAALFNAYCDLVYREQKRRGEVELDVGEIPAYLLLEALKGQATELLGVTSEKPAGALAGKDAQQWAMMASRVELPSNGQPRKHERLEIIIPHEVAALFSTFCNLVNHDRKQRSEVELDENSIAAAVLLRTFHQQAELSRAVSSKTN